MIKSAIMSSTFPNKKTKLIPCAVFFSGCLLRFRAGVLAGFPINDGGMILAMIRDLRSNDFVLPLVTSYNYSDIPFVYPPFGMYVAALVSSQISISEFELLRWLPPLVSAAIIPAFYWLALQICGSQPKAFVAAALYAVMPGSYDWLIMGGGLTRSFGIMFSLFAVGYAYRLVRGYSDKITIVLATVFCALAVLSHPEVGLQTVSIFLLLWAYFGRTVRDVKNLILVGIGTALLTAPWWLTVLHYHGLSPFWSAIQTGIRETLLASLFHSFFSTQGGLPILTIFVLIGIFAVLRKRELFLVLWALIPFFVDPRNAPAIAIFPLLMLASEGLYYLNMEFVRAYSETIQKNQSTDQHLPIMTNGIFGLILLYLVFVSYASASNLVAVSLSISDRETMKWVKENTPLGSQFLLITNRGDISPMTDSYQEWFPVLAERQSQNTLQGNEWILGPRFFEYSQELIALQACPDVHCLKDWLEQKNVQADFILFQKKRASPVLLNSLQADESYYVVYESEHAEIFAFRP